MVKIEYGGEIFLDKAKHPTHFIFSRIPQTLDKISFILKFHACV